MNFAYFLSFFDKANNKKNSNKNNFEDIFFFLQYEN
jgi:hypothetical protein